MPVARENRMRQLWTNVHTWEWKNKMSADYFVYWVSVINCMMWSIVKNGNIRYERCRNERFLEASSHVSDTIL